MSEYYIFGSGLFAELIKLLIIDEKKSTTNKIYFVSKAKIDKKNFIQEEQFFKLKKKKINVFLGLGNIEKRGKLIKKLRSKKYQFPNFISKTSKIHSGCTLGIGNIIMPHSVILPPNNIGNFNIIGIDKSESSYFSWWIWFSIIRVYKNYPKTYG